MRRPLRLICLHVGFATGSRAFGGVGFTQVWVRLSCPIAAVHGLLWCMKVTGCLRLPLHAYEASLKTSHDTAASCAV